MNTFIELFQDFSAMRSVQPDSPLQLNEFVDEHAAFRLHVVRRTLGQRPN